MSDIEEEGGRPEAVGGNEAGEHSCETAEGSNEQAGPNNDKGLLSQEKELTRNSTKQGQGTERLHSRAPGKILFPFLTSKLLRKLVQI